jgi:hypothetical protein
LGKEAQDGVEVAGHSSNGSLNFNIYESQSLITPEVSSFGEQGRPRWWPGLVQFNSSTTAQTPQTQVINGWKVTHTLDLSRNEADIAKKSERKEVYLPLVQRSESEVFEEVHQSMVNNQRTLGLENKKQKGFPKSEDQKQRENE